MSSVNDNLNATIAGYAAQLAVDSVNPLPSYTLDGKSVDRNTWREGLARQIEKLQQIVNAQAPYIVSTKMVL